MSPTTVRTKQHLLDAIDAANPDDEIRISGTIHVEAPIIVRKPLRPEGEGENRKLVFHGLMQRGEGILTTFDDVTVRGLGFHDARSLTGNGVESGTDADTSASIGASSPETRTASWPAGKDRQG